VGQATSIDPRARRAIFAGAADATIADVVARSRSRAQAIKRLGAKPAMSTYRAIDDAIGRLGLDTSHMVGQAWLRGQKGVTVARRMPLDELLVNGKLRRSSHVKRRLLAEGVKEHRCEICGRTEWNGEPIPLQLDHINGDRRDNRMENIRLVCPNCHAQTDTWCGKNIGRYDDDG
jgi:hypothetical protein